MNLRTQITLVFFYCLLLGFPSVLRAQDKPELTLGGALRFNYNYSDWKESNKKRGGDLAFDVFRLNVGGAYKNILLDAEYRFYAASSGGGMLKHGWVGYQFNENHQLQVGLTTVPFGILPYTSNSYFFNINYYLGLEDDADMGIKYVYRKGHWDLALAFFKNADVLDVGDTSEASPDRYAYDIGGRNKETNQGNIRLAYNWGNRWKQQLGTSALLGGIYNLDTHKMGSRTAFSLHYTVDYSNWNLMAQYTTYRMKPRNAEGESRDQVTLVAYAAPYEVAAAADVYTVSLSYTFPIHKGILDNIRVYNDFSMMHKRNNNFDDSYQNITGCLLSMGPVYTYVDCALGKNHSWLGEEWNDAFAVGGRAEWGTRLNVNIGYYF